MSSTVLHTRDTAVNKTSKGVYAQNACYSWKIQTIA